MNWYMIKTKDTYVSKWYIFYFFIFLILLLFLEKLIFEFLKFFFYFFQFLNILWGQTKMRGVMPLYGKWAGSTHIWERHSATGFWGA